MIDHLEIDANGLTFTARAAGPVDGRPVLLLHGFPQTSRAWRAQLGALADAGFRAVAPDQRGYSPGARPRAVSAYCMRHLMGDVLALADALDMASFDLVGHDWGGMVSWMTATLHPERIRSLSVVCTPHPLALHHALIGADPDQAERAGRMDAFRQQAVPEQLLLGDDHSGSGLLSLLAGSGLGPEDARAYAEVLRQPGAMTAALHWYRAMAWDDLLEIRPVIVPTLYVWPSEDPAFGRQAALATEECVAGYYQFAELPGVNHWVPETVPEQLSELLLPHIASA